MDAKLWLKQLKEYLAHRQIMAAALVALLAVLAAFLVLFRTPVPGAVDFGEYTQTLYEMGLSYTQRDLEKPEELTFTRVIEAYEIESIQPLRMLQLVPTRSLIYPVSLTALLCQITGNPFSTRVMAYLMVLTAVFCIYSITKSLYCFCREYAVAAGIGLVFLVFNGSYAVYFNSLYNNGVFLLGLLLYLTVCLSLAANPKKRGLGGITGLFLSSLFLLNASEAAVFMLPVIILANLIFLFYCRPKKGERLPYYGIGILLLFFVVRSNVLFVKESTFFQSDTRQYHSMFTGLLEQAENPAAILQELGLEESLLEDIGKNAYLSGDSYVVAPGSEEAEEEIFRYTSDEKLVSVLMNHPADYGRILDATAKACLKSDNSRFLATGRDMREGTERVERLNYWDFFHGLFAPESGRSFFLFTGIFGVAAVLELIRKRREKACRGLYFTALICLLLYVAEFTLLYVFFGFAEKESLNTYIMLPFDFLLLGGSVYLYVKLGRLVSYLRLGKEETAEEETPEEEEEALNPVSPVGVLVGKAISCLWDKIQDKLLSRPGRCGLVFGMLAAVIVGWVLFWPPGIGAYNNGDFGRMMYAMNLRYTEEDWANSDELSLTKVVEKYDWEEEYDYSKIMPYNADLTQAWFSLPLKIIDNYIGLQFNTRYVAAMYGVITVLCFGVIMKVLFHRFGKRFLLPALFLTVVLLDLGNLGWFNSLFGEGIAFVGFMMVMASSLYVIDSERGTCRFSLFVLLFSILIYSGSKAQFTVTSPFLVIWALILALYHAPRGMIRKLFYFLAFFGGCAWILQSAAAIYNNNQDISSPDAVYQSVFYGLLMISEDDEAVLTELGLDPALAADEGKHAFLDKSEYVCAPRTEEAEEMIYSKVSTMDMLFYYIRHPDKLWTVLDLTAQAAAQTMPDFTLYVGEKTTQEHHLVNRFRIWRDSRYLFVFDRFWQLVIIYGTELVLGAVFLCKRKNGKKDKLFMAHFLLMSLMGLVQFPLTIIGNGFADNTKQLYLFRLTYDITFFMGAYLIFLRAGKAFREKKEKREQKIAEIEEQKDERRGQHEA